jgi:hypothetical protein
MHIYFYVFYIIIIIIIIIIMEFSLIYPIPSVTWKYITDLA